MRLILLMLIALSLPARAAGLSSYYAAEITSGRLARTADGYTKACEAGLTLGGFMETGDPAVRSLHLAIDDCRAALKIKPDHLEASLSYGIGLSFESKRTHKPELARLAKKLFEKLIEERPNDPLPHAALAVWNAHVSRAGLFARLALGGSRRRAHEEFEASFALGAPKKPLMLEYIKFLARGSKQDRATALETYGRYLTLPPADGPLNAILDSRAAALATALRSGDKKAIKKAVAKATAFHGIRDWRTLRALTPEDVAY
ncbi:hypothetical protein K6118_12400 [Kordiimonas sp. A6E486]|nr:hypothetical protein [Kordiimonas marina]